MPHRDPAPVLPPTLAGEAYTGRVLSGGYVNTDDGVTLLLTMRVRQRPFRNIKIAHPLLCSPGMSAEFSRTSRQLANAGITLDEITADDLVALLKGRTLMFEYNPNAANAYHRANIVGVAFVPPNQHKRLKSKSTTPQKEK